VLDTEYCYYLADTDEGKSIHFQLRYNVYCLRERFEDPKFFPDREERDQHDDSSAHFLVRSRSTGDWLGAMRLVVGRASELPMNRIAPIDTANLAAIDEEQVAEASRLCTILPKMHRPRSNGHPRPRNLHGEPNSRHHRVLHASAMTVGLIRAARTYSLERGIVNCYFLINDPLARILRHLGMEIAPVGELCEHRGWRRPYRHNFETGYDQMARQSPELFESFCTPTAYERFSEIDQSVEETALAINA
jgi:N-acyl amino acid synthase of PEP-CTERM/exosortase system